MNSPGSMTSTRWWISYGSLSAVGRFLPTLNGWQSDLSRSQQRWKTSLIQPSRGNSVKSNEQADVPSLAGRGLCVVFFLWYGYGGNTCDSILVGKGLLHMHVGARQPHLSHQQEGVARCQRSNRCPEKRIGTSWIRKMRWRWHVSCFRTVLLRRPWLGCCPIRLLRMAGARCWILPVARVAGYWTSHKAIQRSR